MSYSRPLKQAGLRLICVYPCIRTMCLLPIYLNLRVYLEKIKLLIKVKFQANKHFMGNY